LGLITFVHYNLNMEKITLAIHGGAGTILKTMLTPELELRYNKGLQDALDIGYSVLENKGTSLDAVIASIKSLEDNELFNAGKGSVFTKKGINEMDAAIMDGSNLNAGAVAGVRNIKNPIVLAKEIMDHSGHVMLCGNGAKEFALNRGIEQAPDDYFFTKYRYDQWIEIRDSDFYQLDHKEDKLKGMAMEEKKFGTVGAVALDVHGHIAAGTSTGGMTNKRYNRIGDSPIPGSGTYANDKTCAISCTGHGEYFLRAVVAYDVSCLMEYKGLTLREACHIVVKEKLVKLGGEGGLIAVDALGNYDLCYNSDGMYRGVKTSDGVSKVAIYKD
jgi:beta-aspartyl-peptidase (threonine type)